MSIINYIKSFAYYPREKEPEVILPPKALDFGLKMRTLVSTQSPLPYENQIMSSLSEKFSEHRRELNQRQIDLLQGLKRRAEEDIVQLKQMRWNLLTCRPVHDVKAESYGIKPSFSYVQKRIADKEKLIQQIEEDLSSLQKSQVVSHERKIAPLAEIKPHRSIKEHYVISFGEDVQDVAVIRKPKLQEKDANKRWAEWMVNPEAVEELAALLRRVEKQENPFRVAGWRGFHFDVFFAKGHKPPDLNSQRCWQRWSEESEMAIGVDVHMVNATARQWAQMVLNGKMNEMNTKEARAIGEYLDAVKKSPIAHFKGQCPPFVQSMRILDFIRRKSMEQYFLPGALHTHLQTEVNYRPKEDAMRVFLIVQDLFRNYEEVAINLDKFCDKVERFPKFKSLIPERYLLEMRDYAKLIREELVQKALPEIRELLDRYKQLQIVVFNPEYVKFVKEKSQSWGPQKVDEIVSKSMRDLGRFLIQAEPKIKFLQPFLSSKEFKIQVERLCYEKVLKMEGLKPKIKVLPVAQYQEVYILQRDKLEDIWKKPSQLKMTLREILKGTDFSTAWYETIKTANVIDQMMLRLES
jgi:hypothetical protein